mgnify:CR=1 FL=1
MLCTDSGLTALAQAAAALDTSIETMVWLPKVCALIPGDRLLGDDERCGVRLCPDSWLRYLPSGMRQRELREALRPLLDLPVELVLVSHGEPVLKGGREAIAKALKG